MKPLSPEERELLKVLQTRAQVPAEDVPSLPRAYSESDWSLVPGSSAMTDASKAPRGPDS